MRFEGLDIDDTNMINEMSKLASGIVKEHYDPILGAEQNDYMIEKFQSAPAITEQLEHGYRYYFVVDDDGERAGFMAFYKRGAELYLSKLYLKKEYRGRGIARKMLHFAIASAHDMCVDRIVLNVNKYNEAVKVYEKLGFQRIRDEKNDIGHGYYMDDYVYQYKLS